jgi:hypothetical protein
MSHSRQERCSTRSLPGGQTGSNAIGEQGLDLHRGEGREATTQNAKRRPIHVGTHPGWSGIRESGRREFSHGAAAFWRRPRSQRLSMSAPLRQLSSRGHVKCLPWHTGHPSRQTEIHSSSESLLNTMSRSLWVDCGGEHRVFLMRGHASKSRPDAGGAEDVPAGRATRRCADCSRSTPA